MIGVRSDALVKMARFPSEEWTKLYAEKLNANKSYEDAGKNWEGAITFVVQKDSALDKDAFIYLDLYHGKCRDAKFSLTESDLPTPEYKYAGPYGNWRKLINKEIDPIQGLLTGKFKLQGSMMKIMSFTKAAKEMVNTTASVQTES
jgi:putative sterol carrier protein